MIKEVYRFSVSTGYVGSRQIEDVEIEFDGDEIEEEREKIIQEYFDEWMWSKIDTGWKRIR